MTGEQLKAELARIAERAPQVEVADDLFTRGRRAAVRTRVLVAAAAVACLALVVGVGAQALRSDEAPVAGDGAPFGVPNVIYGPPLHERPLDLPVTALDEVGRAAVAYQVEDAEGHLVLITPEGDYRAVLLPNQWEPGLDDATPVLSPDGSRLAYASQHDLVRGLSIVDLTSGDVRDVTLGPDPGALVDSLQWSPDSRWLAWSGQRVKQARDSGASYRPGTIAGLVAPGATTSRTPPGVAKNSSRGLGVCNDGTPLGSARSDSWADLTAAHGACTPPRSYLRHPGPAHLRLLGWLPTNPGDPGPVAVVQVEHSRLTLAWPAGARERVGRIEAGWSKNLTVATGLMTADRPTVEAGPSPWDRPWVVEHWLALLVSLGIGAAMILVLVRARAVRR